MQYMMCDVLFVIHDVSQYLENLDLISLGTTKFILRGPFNFFLNFPSKQTLGVYQMYAVSYKAS